MNFCWRITKYNPQYRNSKDVFLNNEWTSFSDIGTIFNSKELTYEEYVQTENLYLIAIKEIMTCNGIISLQVVDLEKPKKLDIDIYNTANMIELFNNIQEKNWITQNNIEDFCRLILRDKLWCKLVHDEKIFIHFGWDFYMYIGSSAPCIQAISAIQQSGLFIESFNSPHQT